MIKPAAASGGLDTPHSPHTVLRSPRRERTSSRRCRSSPRRRRCAPLFARLMRPVGVAGRAGFDSTTFSLLACTVVNIAEPRWRSWLRFSYVFVDGVLGSYYDVPQRKLARVADALELVTYADGDVLIEQVRLIVNLRWSIVNLALGLFGLGYSSRIRHVVTGLGGVH
jgi:hypothetical protein